VLERLFPVTELIFFAAAAVAGVVAANVARVNGHWRLGGWFAASFLLALRCRQNGLLFGLGVRCLG
jgi:hypothetical protein